MPRERVVVSELGRGSPSSGAPRGWVGGTASHDAGSTAIGDRLVALAERRFHARPMTEDVAREALEWVAAREGKTFAELIEELRGAGDGGDYPALPVRRRGAGIAPV